MKQRSRKIKGRRLTNFVRDKILRAFPHLRAKDVVCVENGLPGPDLILSKVAKALVPFQWEMKNQQKMKTIYTWHKQASKGAGELTPVVVAKQTSKDPLVIIDFKEFIKLIK